MKGSGALDELDTKQAGGGGCKPSGFWLLFCGKEDGGAQQQQALKK
jgi:hypothetical protein